MKFILFLSYILMLCVSYGSSQKPINCNKNTMKRIDELVAKLTTYGNSGRKFPEKVEEVPKYCNDSKVLVDAIESLNKDCIKGLSKQILSIGMYSINTKIKKSCKKTSKTNDDQFASAKCVNKAQNELSKCFSKSIDNLLGMQNAEEKKRIPMACCEVYKTKECIATKLGKIDICTELHTEITNNFIQSIIGNSLNFACAEFSEDSDKCSTLTVPKKKKSQRRTKSMIMAFLQLFESFPEANQKS